MRGSLFGFSDVYNLYLLLVSIPAGFSIASYIQGANQFIGSVIYYLYLFLYPENFSVSSPKDRLMQTGIGVIVEVKQILWVQENPSYPAEERYIGELETTAGEVLSFSTDIDVPFEQTDWKAVGRIDWERDVLEISDHNI